MIPYYDIGGSWNDVFDKNLSVRLINANDTSLAFIKMDVTLDSSLASGLLDYCISIKSYEFNGSFITVPELKTNELINIFPNPTNGFIQINTDEKIENVDIYSLDGKMIRSGIKSKSFDLGINDNFQGPLLLKISFGNSVIYKMIILY